MTDLYLSGGLLIAIQAASLLTVILHILGERQLTLLQRRGAGIFLTILLVVLIGLRPINGLYIDMTTYALAFERSKWGLSKVTLGDPLFDVFTNFAAEIMSVGAYFFACAFLYVVPKTIASRKMFGVQAPLALAAMASSFSFYGFATNGIRNGIAASLALLAMAWPRFAGKIIFGIMAILTHLSLIASLFAYVIASRFKSIKICLVFWVIAIPISFLLPGTMFAPIASLQFDERTNYFANQGEFATGFRFDFLVYSAMGVAAIIYWKFVRKIDDLEFDRLANTYLIANSVWILVNQVAFSNRFAYLSWFLLEIVAIFPILKGKGGEVTIPVLGLIVFNIILTWAII